MLVGTLVARPMDENTELKPPSTEMIQGREILLSTGAKVWGGVLLDSTIWRFTSKDGAVTRVKLSHEAVCALVQLFQGLLGCDEDFAAVTFDPPSHSAGE